MDGKTAIDWAVRRDTIATLQILVDGANIGFRDNVGRTVMHTAAERGSILAIEHLLTLRPEAIHDVDNKLRTPLLWAAACNELGTTRVLLLKGSDVHHTDISGGLTAPRWRPRSLLTVHMAHWETANRSAPLVTSVTYVVVLPCWIMSRCCVDVAVLTIDDPWVMGFSNRTLIFIIGQCPF